MEELVEVHCEAWAIAFWGGVGRSTWNKGGWGNLSVVKAWATARVTLSCVAAKHEIKHCLVGRATPRWGHRPCSHKDLWVEVFRYGQRGAPGWIEAKWGLGGCAPIEFCILKPCRVAERPRVA